MNRFTRNPLAAVLLISLLGIGASLLRWYQLSIFGSSTGIVGYRVWQGKVAVGLFVAAGLLAAILRRSPRYQAACTIAVGVAIAGLAGHYVCQIIFPASTHIEVYEGGEIARALGQGFVTNMRGHLSVGAPATLLLGLGLVVVGILQRRGVNAASAPPQIP